MTTPPPDESRRVPRTKQAVHAGKGATRLARYLLARTIAVLLTVAIGVYVAVWVTNLGGNADAQRKAGIRASIELSAVLDHELWALPYEERIARLEEMYEMGYRQVNLHRPFFYRCFGYTAAALSLSVGETESLILGISGSTRVVDLLLERMPTTVVLFVTANLLTFFCSLSLSLLLSRRYGSILDRLSTLMIPLLSAPPWLHGVFVIIIFASILNLLPLLAWMLGMVPFTLYANRAFFLIHSREDYVELAKAKGVRPSVIQRRHILRPVLPPVITSFAFMMIAAWQGSILVERVFAWPGLGEVLFNAVEVFDIPVIMGSAAIFAYLLGGTVLTLDIAYALVDPRVKIGKDRYG